MKTPDLEAIKEIIVSVAETEVMPRFNNLSVSEIGTKNSPEDLVTVADTETEKKLTLLLKASLPGSQVVGEEATFRDPSLWTVCMAMTRYGIIDPIDGRRILLMADGNRRLWWLWCPKAKTIADEFTILSAGHGHGEKAAGHG